jgi:hypothetical protein
MTNDDSISGVSVAYGYKGEALFSCTARIYKGGETPSVEITEFLSENKRSTPNWNQMPHRMLRHRALMQATRIACGLHGVYDREEAAAVPGVEAGPVETEAVVVETPTIDLSKAKDASKEDKAAVEWAAPGATDLDTASVVKEMFSDD